MHRIAAWLFIGLLAASAIATTALAQVSTPSPDEIRAQIAELRAQISVLEAMLPPSEITLSGTGKHLSAESFHLDEAIYRVDATCNATLGMFDAVNGSGSATLIDLYNGGTGSNAARIYEQGDYFLDVTCEGPWTITIDRLPG